MRKKSRQKPSEKSQGAAKRIAKQEERDRQYHLHHGFPPGEFKGVEIVSKNKKPNLDQEKGVEIHDQRHG